MAKKPIIGIEDDPTQSGQGPTDLSFRWSNDKVLVDAEMLGDTLRDGGLRSVAVSRAKERLLGSYPIEDRGDIADLLGDIFNGRFEYQVLAADHSIKSMTIVLASCGKFIENSVQTILVPTKSCDQLANILACNLDLFSTDRGSLEPIIRAAAASYYEASVLWMALSYLTAKDLPYPFQFEMSDLKKHMTETDHIFGESGRPTGLEYSDFLNLRIAVDLAYSAMLDRLSDRNSVFSGDAGLAVLRGRKYQTGLRSFQATGDPFFAALAQPVFGQRAPGNVVQLFAV